MSIQKNCLMRRLDCKIFKMSSKTYLTYLAGAFCPYQKGGKIYEDWRDFVIENTNNKKIKFYDPRVDSRQLCPATFTIDDAIGVLKSDVLLHYRTRGYEDEGASWEHGIAFATNLINQKVKTGFPNKLIVYVDDTRAVWTLNFSSANINFSALETAVNFLNNIDSLKKSDWVKIYMEIINKDRRD